MKPLALLLFLICLVVFFCVLLSSCASVHYVQVDSAGTKTEVIRNDFLRNTDRESITAGEFKYVVRDQDETESLNALFRYLISEKMFSTLLGRSKSSDSVDKTALRERATTARTRVLSSERVRATEARETTKRLLSN